MGAVRLWSMAMPILLPVLSGGVRLSEASHPQPCSPGKPRRREPEGLRGLTQRRKGAKEDEGRREARRISIAFLVLVLVLRAAVLVLVLDAGK